MVHSCVEQAANPKFPNVQRPQLDATRLIFATVADYVYISMENRFALRVVMLWHIGNRTLLLIIYGFRLESGQWTVDCLGNEG